MIEAAPTPTAPPTTAPAIAAAINCLLSRDGTTSISGSVVISDVLSIPCFVAGSSLITSTSDVSSSSLSVSSLSSSCGDNNGEDIRGFFNLLIFSSVGTVDGFDSLSFPDILDISFCDDPPSFLIILLSFLLSLSLSLSLLLFILLISFISLISSSFNAPFVLLFGDVANTSCIISFKVLSSSSSSSSVSVLSSSSIIFPF